MGDVETYRETILQFVKENHTVFQFKFILDDLDGVRIEPVTTDGMINYIYRVQSAKGDESLILKYGEDRVRVKFGSGDSVTLKRQMVEYEALKLIHSIQPGTVARPYCFDSQHRIIAMEDLSHMHLLHDDLVKGNIDLDIAKQLGQMLGKLHKSTHRDNVSKEHWQKLGEKFGDKDIKGLIISYRLIRAFIEEDSFNVIPAECLNTYQKCSAQIEDSGALPKLLELYNQEWCVVHVDIHSKSVFVSDTRFAVIDCEWATLGHPVIDLAYTMTWYIFSMLEMKDGPAADWQAFKDKTRKALENMVDGYFMMYEVDSKSRDLFISQLAAFIGAFIFGHTNFRNIDNLARLGPDRRIEAMELGTKLMTNFCTSPITDISTLFHILFSPVESVKNLMNDK